MSFSMDLKQELLNQKVWDSKSSMKQVEQIDRICVREAFIEKGFINDPNKSYHLEILLKTNEKAQEIKEILRKYYINSKIIIKNKQYMIYIKDGEEISKFLAFVGAAKSVMRFEEIRVERYMNNKDFVEYLKQRLFIELKKQTASMFDTGSARKNTSVIEYVYK